MMVLFNTFPEQIEKLCSILSFKENFLAAVTPWVT